jgi:4-amino-4-deoxy-L-arabinose transferase-like glycosyltransferase
MLLAVYELGRVLEDWLLGLTAAFVCGTTYFFLKFAWQASYDLHLALWVTLADLGLAMATFRDRRWSGIALAGASLGVALMVKGPVALLQTLAPWVVFLVWRRWRWKEEGTASKWTAPLAVGAGLMALIALPWTLYAMWINRHMLGVIYNEVSLGTEAGYETRVRWHSYIVFFPLMLPWLIWFLTGLVQIIRDGRKTGRFVLLVFWLVLPIVVMTFFPERRDRYLLPMLGPAALIAAYGVLRHVPRWKTWTPIQRGLVILHGATLAAVAIGLPIWGVVSGRTVEDRPWYTIPFAAGAIAVAVVIAAANLMLYRRSRVGFVAGTVLLTLLANLVFMWGYKDSISGRSQGKVLAAEILGRYPNAEVYNAGPGERKLLPLEFLIYLDRDVPALDDPAKLPPSDRPQVLIYPPGEDGDANAPAPPGGFHEITRRQINTGVYRVYARSN